MKIQIAESAIEDLLAGFRFYEEQEEGVGQYFIDALFTDIDSLTLYAGVHPIKQGYFRMIAKRFPFAVYYKVERKIVRVRRVLDCRRNPTWIRKELKR